MTQAFAWSEDDNRGRESSYLIFPFFWNQGVSDNLNLVWFPLPLEMRAQVVRSSHYQLGLGLNVFASILYQFQGFNWTPFADVDQRFYLHSDFALDWNVHLQLEVRRSTPALHGAVAQWVGPLYQASDAIYLKAQAGMFLEFENPQSIYLNRAPVNPSSGPFWRFPVRLMAGYQVHERWQIEGQWTSFVWGYDLSSNYRNHAFFLDLTHIF